MNALVEANFNNIQKMCKFYQKYDFNDETGKADLCYYSEDKMKDIRECDVFYCPFVNLSKDDLE